MRAEIFGEGDVARLVEAADEVARLEHGAQHRGRIVRVGAQIAVAQIVRGKQRRAAGEIDHEVAARHRAVARRPERQRAARGRRGRRVVVDRQLERAEMSLGGADRALDDRKLGHARRREILRPR